MKKGLVKHISEIFTTLQVTVPFDVYSCNVDILPEWTEHIQLTHEYLVCCEEITERQRLQTFIGKNIFEFGSYIYWFEGDRNIAIEPVDIENSDETTEQSIYFLKTDTRLPASLDDFIYNQLNAEYAPNFQRFDYNLDLTKEENLKYLGTYFPRSYAESFCIFDNIFQNRVYQKAISTKETLNILSVGCGTGGDLTGLMTIIEKYCQQISEVNIWALDGNAEALLMLETIIGKFKAQSSKSITLITIKSVFNSISSSDIQQIIQHKFDYILSFKLICEIISMGKGRLDNSYYDFVKTFVPLLSDKGLCVLLDVTTKLKHTTYNPILMNRQVNQSLRELKQYKTLLPLSCGIHSSKCYIDCFYQKTFSVTHQKQTKDKSKVAYRIIAHNNFVNLIENIDNEAKYLIHNDKFCPFTESNQKSEDAYLLKETKEELTGPSETPIPERNETEKLPIVSIQNSSDNYEIFKTETPKIGVKIIGQIDLSQFERPKKEIKPDKENYYIIDTNVFVECPDIISKINKSYHIILSAKVVDELDNLKTTLQDEDKKNVQRALKRINDNFGKRDLKMDTADFKLLPTDFNKRSPDNLILSVALKYKDENPILLTSDNGLQIKAKGMNITTITLKEFLKPPK